MWPFHQWHTLCQKLCFHLNYNCSWAATSFSNQISTLKWICAWRLFKFNVAAHSKTSLYKSDWSFHNIISCDSTSLIMLVFNYALMVGTSRFKIQHADLWRYGQYMSAVVCCFCKLPFVRSALPAAILNELVITCEIKTEELQWSRQEN